MKSFGKINISLYQFVLVNLIRNLKYKLLVKFGLILRAALGAAESYVGLVRDNDKKILSSDEIDYFNGVADSYFAQFTSLQPIDVELQEKSIKILRGLLSGSEIRSVINVGSRYDIVSKQLAPEFPGVDFLSIDFGENLDKHIRQLCMVSDNWKIRGGYPLSHFIEQNSGDVVLFSGVTVWLTNAEYRAYLDHLSNFAKKVVVVDVWSTAYKQSKIFSILRPESIDPKNSLVMTPSQGGRYAHNHIKMLEQAGFNVSDYRIDGFNSLTYIISIVGTRN